MKNSPVIVALDFPSAEKALMLVERLDPSQCRLKVGFELFVAAGPALIDTLHQRGFEVFLDLKFHDIPNTVASACRASADLGVWMLNVHASGGSRMMEAAREAVDRASQQPLLIAVTILTSMSSEDLGEIGINVSPQEQVLRLAQLAKNSGMDGVVCSAQEAGSLRQQLGQGFVLVTPGIRPASMAGGDDQRRIMTPREAVETGSNYLVIGRPITRAASPRDALNEVLVSLD